MSTLIGTESDRWSLPRAIDALAESARQAGHPGLVWIAGFFYPTLTLGLDLGWDGPLTHSAGALLGKAWNDGQTPGAVWKLLQFLPIGALTVFFAAPCVGVFFMPFFRLIAGLARVGPARAWEAARAGRSAPQLRMVWAAGEGLMLPTFGLWLQLALMIGCALFLGSLPAAALAATIGDPAESPKSAVLMGALIVPILVVLMAYALALSVLNQLALHSLAHNRRGVYSALLHGWRIMRNDPWATARAVLVDLVLFLTILMAWRLFTGFSDWLRGAGEVLATIAKVLLVSFAGVARAGYWARAYRALGGLSPDDGVPGL
ncbi:MAG: hypothetical protein ACKVXR_08700 [Planctomycetota bacterium]